MNRRARRRAARRGRRVRRERRGLTPSARIALAVVGVALIAGGILLAAHGGVARAGRLLGVVIVLGVACLVVAWRGAGGRL